MGQMLYFDSKLAEEMSPPPKYIYVSVLSSDRIFLPYRSHYMPCYWLWKDLVLVANEVQCQFDDGNIAGYRRPACLKTTI